MQFRRGESIHGRLFGCAVGVVVGVAVCVGVGVFGRMTAGKKARAGKVAVAVGVGDGGGTYNTAPDPLTYPSKLNVHGAALEL